MANGVVSYLTVSMRQRQNQNQKERIISERAPHPTHNPGLQPRALCITSCLLLLLNSNTKSVKGEE